MSRHSATVLAKGFSQSTCLPALRASTHISACNQGGVDTITASTSSRRIRSRQSRSTTAENFDAMVEARCGSTSLTAVNRSEGALATASARHCPIPPQPINPNRMPFSCVPLFIFHLPLSDNPQSGTEQFQSWPDHGELTYPVVDP